MHAILSFATFDGSFLLACLKLRKSENEKYAALNHAQNRQWINALSMEKRPSREGWSRFVYIDRKSNIVSKCWQFAWRTAHFHRAMGCSQPQRAMRGENTRDQCNITTIRKLYQIRLIKLMVTPERRKFDHRAKLNKTSGWQNKGLHWAHKKP